MDAKPKFKASNLSTMTHMSREFIIYQVEENELDRLNSDYTSVHFSLFGIALGALLLAVTTLRTVSNLSDHDHTLYFCLAVMAGFLSCTLPLCPSKTIEPRKRT